MQLHVEPEVHHIAVLNDVVLSFDSELSCGLQAGLALVFEDVGNRVDLGTDEASLEVRVDDSSSLRGFEALLDGPGTNLFGTAREVGLKTEETVGLTGESVEAGLSES